MASQPYRLVLRLPEELRVRVTEAAHRYRRSLNSEIIARLEQSLGGMPRDANESELEPPFFAQIETALRHDLTDEEDALIRLYRRLSAKQRSALLNLLKG